MSASDSTGPIRFPDSPLARAADALARSCQTAGVLAHSRRTYLYGGAALHAAGRPADEEAMYVAAMLHDVALGGRLDDGRTPFEQLSAQAARDLVIHHGAGDRIAGLVHDAVTLHLDLATAKDPRPEVVGVHLGALVDVLGIGLDQLPREFVEAVLAAYPREGLTAHLTTILRAEATAKPSSRTSVLVREQGLLQAIAQASFPPDPRSGDDAVAGRLTPFGTATVLLEVGGFRLLTDPVLDSGPLDPVFDVPSLGLSVPLHRRSGSVASAPELLPDLDIVLLTHDHPDHLDATGREALARATTVLTTLPAAARLAADGIKGVVGLEPGASHTITRAGRCLSVTATPAWHGPEHLLPVMGEVIGFLVGTDDTDGLIYITGDTLVTPELAPEVLGLAAGRPIGTLIAHLGGAQFEAAGPTRFTMDGAEAADLCLRLDARCVVPVHEDDWEHFTQTAADTDEAFARAGAADRLVRVAPGKATELTRPGLRARRHR